MKSKFKVGDVIRLTRNPESMPRQVEMIIWIGLEAMKPEVFLKTKPFCTSNDEKILQVISALDREDKDIIVFREEECFKLCR